MGVHQQETGSAGVPEQQLPMIGTVAAVSCNDVHSFTKPVRNLITLVPGLGVSGDVHAGVTVRHRSRVAVDPDQPNLRQVHLIHSELHDELIEAGYEVPAGGLGENVTTTGIDLLGLPVGTILRFGPALDAEAGSASGSGPAHGAGAGFVPGSAPGSASGPTDSAGETSAAPSESRSELPAAPAGAAPAAAAPAGGAAAVLAAARNAARDESMADAVAALSARLAAEDDQSSDPRPAIVITGLRNPCQQINRYRSGLLKQVLRKEADGSLTRLAGVMAVVLRGGPIRPGDEIQVELPARPHLPLDRV